MLANFAILLCLLHNFDREVDTLDCLTTVQNIATPVPLNLVNVLKLFNIREFS